MATTMTGYTSAPPYMAGLVGKTIYVSSAGVYYKVKRTAHLENFSKDISPLQGATLWNALLPVFTASYTSNTSSAYLECDSFNLLGPLNIHTYELEVVGAKAKTTITDTRVHLQDQPYDMFCIPYSDEMLFDYNGTKTKYSKSLAMSLAQQIAGDLGSAAIYDIQITPYCPVRNLINTEGEVPTIQSKDVATTLIYGENEEVIAGLFWAPSSQFSFDLNYTIELPSTPVEQKIMATCDKYRLCSPNMAAMFDFSPVDNGGLTAIEVNCYYKPFNPYIHLNPHFGGIYAAPGVPYEVRGLDCSGNFSLTQVNNAWADYQLQNKNFEAMFQRQQDALKLQHDFQFGADIATGITGTASALGQGAMVGGVPGAITGGALSATGGVIDILMNRRLREEERSLAQDLYNYQLGNIQALPNTLTKIDTLSQNNPLVPFMEYYTSTEVEKNAIRNALVYNGMTVGRISTIQEFLLDEPSYIQGKIIRMVGLGEDYHIVQTIATELQKGVYM
jgi:hypothetical protein